METKMKIGIVGHIGIGKTTIIESLIEAVENRTGEKIEFVTIHANEKDFFSQPISERAISITNEMRCHLFTPPMSRAEHRKLERKNKKR